jgi:hypothetical protein
VTVYVGVECCGCGGQGSYSYVIDDDDGCWDEAEETCSECLGTGWLTEEDKAQHDGES